AATSRWCPRCRLPKGTPTGRTSTPPTRPRILPRSGRQCVSRCWSTRYWARPCVGRLSSLAWETAGGTTTACYITSTRPSRSTSCHEARIRHIIIIFAIGGRYLVAIGLLAADRLAVSKALAEHLDHFAGELRAKGNSPFHIEVVTGRARRVFDGCG